MKGYKKVYFNNIPQIGNLYLEDIFNTFEDENILFTCSNEKHELYLCVCYELRKALKWIINKVEVNDIVKLINKEITINDIFRIGNDKKIRIIFTYENGQQVDYPTLSEIEELLPTKGIYLNIDNNIINKDKYSLKKMKKKIIDEIKKPIPEERFMSNEYDIWINKCYSSLRKN